MADIANWSTHFALKWSHDDAIIKLERLSERERNYQSNELEEPDLAIVVECERALHHRYEKPLVH